LIKYEGHAQHAFPEINGRLPVCAGEGDMVNTLYLNFPHSVPFAKRVV
jgi:hypothetical protein